VKEKLREKFIGGDHGAEFGGWKKFRRPRFLDDFYKKFHFHAQNIWWPFSLVIDHVFRIFTVWTVIFDPFFTRKTPISENNSFDDTFFTLFVLLRASNNTTSQNIMGDGCMGLPPPHILGGPSPQSPQVSAHGKIDLETITSPKLSFIYVGLFDYCSFERSFRLELNTTTSSLTGKQTINYYSIKIRWHRTYITRATLYFGIEASTSIGKWTIRRKQLQA